MKFYQKFLQREIEAEEIFEYIETWHKSNTKESIYEFLGLTAKEYEIFIRYPENVESLRSI